MRGWPDKVGLLAARRVAGAPAGALAWLRSRAYERGLLAVHRAPVPVLAVGNLSWGGTGKTPLVAFLVERLRARGRSPGVLARGYGRAPGEALNDEGRLLAARFPGLPQEQRPDRAAAARALLAKGAADCLILDDGFQHRRLARDLDLVCLDCTRPWFRDAPFPGGRLREWPGALARADLLILTRADEAGPGLRDACREAAARDSGGVPTALAAHVARDLLELGPGMGAGPSLAPGALAGRRVFLFCAIGAPRSFARTVSAAGAELAGMRAFRDHRRLGPERLERVAAEAARAGAEVLLTTEKDLARQGSFPFPVWVLRVDLGFLEGQERLLDALDRLCAEARP